MTHKCIAAVIRLDAALLGPRLLELPFGERKWFYLSPSSILDFQPLAAEVTFCHADLRDFSCIFVCLINSFTRYARSFAEADDRVNGPRANERAKDRRRSLS